MMKHFIAGQNIGLVVGPQGQVVGAMPWNLAFISTFITDTNIYYRGGGIVFPLYCYIEKTDRDKNVAEKLSPMLEFGVECDCENGHSNSATKIPNLDIGVIGKFSKHVKLGFEGQRSSDANKFSPEDLLDYIYAALHSPSYRDKYSEFLKTDFPRVPYPSNAVEFRRLVKLGAELRALHLMEHPELNKVLHEYSFPAIGDNAVEKLRWQPLAPNNHLGRVWINEKQYFDGVPLVSWEFYIGGYQPAQKWLKDRKGHNLTFEDIEHYQKIIKALAMTIEIMDKIG